MINSINSIHINSLFLFTMEKKKNGTYESPRTTRTQVSLESGICTSSKDKVVQDDEKANVDINQQENGGSFELDSWD